MSGGQVAGGIRPEDDEQLKVGNGTGEGSGVISPAR